MKINDGQITKIVEDYCRVMPGWQQASAETLARVDGPVVQAIGFQCLASGVYRPMNYVSVLVAPEPSRRGRADFLVQSPRSSPRTLSLRSHAELHGRMFDAMKSEFTPTITAPLCARRVLDL